MEFQDLNQISIQVIFFVGLICSTKNEILYLVYQVFKNNLKILIVMNKILTCMAKYLPLKVD